MSKRSFIGVKYGRVQIKGVYLFEGFIFYFLFFKKIKFVFEFKYSYTLIYLFVWNNVRRGVLDNLEHRKLAFPILLIYKTKIISLPSALILTSNYMMGPFSNIILITLFKCCENTCCVIWTVITQPNRPYIYIFIKLSFMTMHNTYS